MKKMFALLLPIAAALVSSCAPALVRPAMQEVKLPPERLVQNGYSVVPLDEPGWLIAFRNPEQLVLGKRASDPDENFIVRAFAQVLPPFNSEEEFLGFAKSVLVMEGATRHKVLSQEARRVTVKGQSCVQTNTVMEDHAAVKRSSRSGPMILVAYAMLCTHPNKSTGILVAYSHRYYDGHEDQESPKKARKIFDSLEFLSLAP